jgi:hypothetical protein
MSKRLVVYFEQTPVRVLRPTAPAVIELGQGMFAEETFLGTETNEGKFTLTVHKLVSAAEEVDPADKLLRATLEDLRLVWPIAGGSGVVPAFISNAEDLYAEFLKERDQHRVSRSFGLGVESGCTYRTMPLNRAVELLRELGRLPTAGQPTNRAQDKLWLCIQWYDMASAAETALDKFMKSFPPLDLLASMSSRRSVYCSHTANILFEILRAIVWLFKPLVERRVAEVLLGTLEANRLNTETLADKGEALIKEKLPPEEVGHWIRRFGELYKLRNKLFHGAKNQAIDGKAAEDTRTLLAKCLLGVFG